MLFDLGDSFFRTMLSFLNLCGWYFSFAVFCPNPFRTNSCGIFSLCLFIEFFSFRVGTFSYLPNPPSFL